MKRIMLMARDKGQPSRFQNKFDWTLNLHSNQRMQDETNMLMALSKHIPEIEHFDDLIRHLLNRSDQKNTLVSRTR